MSNNRWTIAMEEAAQRWYNRRQLGERRSFRVPSCIHGAPLIVALLLLAAGCIKDQSAPVAPSSIAAKVAEGDDAGRALIDVSITGELTGEGMVKFDSLIAFLQRSNGVPQSEAELSVRLSECPVTLSSSLCYAAVTGNESALLSELSSFGSSANESVCPFVRVYPNARYCNHGYTVFWLGKGCPQTFTEVLPKGEHGAETWVFTRTSPYARTSGSLYENYRAVITFPGGTIQTQGKLFCEHGTGYFLARHPMI